MTLMPLFSAYFNLKLMNLNNRVGQILDLFNLPCIILYKKSPISFFCYTDDDFNSVLCLFQHYTETMKG